MGEVKIYNSRYYNENERNVNIFAPDFFTSSDVVVTINGEKIRDISAIQYSLQEQLKPIFGYGSYTYDDIAVGSRIVTGTIICPLRNIKENDEFKCVNENSKSINQAANEYLKNKYENNRTEAILRRSEYKIDLSSDTPIYLSPKFDYEVAKVYNNDTIVKKETDNYYYVYLVNDNIFGYVRKK